MLFLFLGPFQAFSDFQIFSAFAATY